MDIAQRDQAMEVERATASSSKSRNQRKKGKKGAIQLLLDESGLQGINGAAKRSGVQRSKAAEEEQLQRAKEKEEEQ